MSPVVVRRLTLGLATVYAVMGTVEVVQKVQGEAAVATVAFFGGTLLGGAVLILCGTWGRLPASARRPLVMLGAAIGLLASAWTLVVPVLAMAVIVGQVSTTGDTTSTDPV